MAECLMIHIESMSTYKKKIYVFSLIENETREKGYCELSVEEMANKLNRSKRTVSAHLKALKEIGAITPIGFNARRIVKYTAYIEGVINWTSI